jgi:glutathione S-transferase
VDDYGKRFNWSISKVIFESNVIVEYLDEAYPPSMTPSDPLLRSLNRSYFSYATEILNT